MNEQQIIRELGYIPEQMTPEDHRMVAWVKNAREVAALRRKLTDNRT